MNLMWIKTNRLIKLIFRNYVWEIPNSKKKIYLTFDDGPVSGITEWILDVLKEHQVKATFFCIGKNIESNPGIFEKIIKGGHQTGNHTFNHVKGWETSVEEYLENTLLCQESINKRIPENASRLFRPPYGKIKLSQSKKLRKLGYKIIMWDVLSVDYDIKVTPEECLKNVIENTVSGSIIVFHDSIKAHKNVRAVLPEAIKILKEKGFVFEKIS